MAQVTVLRRETFVVSVSPGQAEERVAVVYSTPAVPPRIVYLPLANYRAATPQEAQANPRFLWYPRDKGAEEAERKAIAEDLALATRGLPTTFEVT